MAQRLKDGWPVSGQRRMWRSLMSSMQLKQDLFLLFSFAFLGHV